MNSNHKGIFNWNHKALAAETHPFDSAMRFPFSLRCTSPGSKSGPETPQRNQALFTLSTMAETEGTKMSPSANWEAKPTQKTIGENGMKKIIVCSKLPLEVIHSGFKAISTGLRLEEVKVCIKFRERNVLGHWAFDSWSRDFHRVFDSPGIDKDNDKSYQVAPDQGHTHGIRQGLRSHLGRDLEV